MWQNRSNAGHMSCTGITSGASSVSRSISKQGTSTDPSTSWIWWKWASSAVTLGVHFSCPCFRRFGAGWSSGGQAQRKSQTLSTKHNIAKHIIC